MLSNMRLVWVYRHDAVACQKANGASIFNGQQNTADLPQLHFVHGSGSATFSPPLPCHRCNIIGRKLLRFVSPRLPFGSGVGFGSPLESHVCEIGPWTRLFSAHLFSGEVLLSGPRDTGVKEAACWAAHRSE